MPNGIDDWGVWSILDLRANDCSWNTGPFGIDVRRAWMASTRQNLYELTVTYRDNVELGEVLVDDELQMDGEMLRSRIEQEIRLLANQALGRRPKAKENKSAVYAVLLAAARRWAA